jgi:hypothetical protein
VLRKLFNDVGETEIAATMDFVGGWPNLASEREPERWLDGCREAVIIMDGDVGRKLTKRSEPLTDLAKEIDRRFDGHALRLRVLRRYGIENYFPLRAYETVLQRDLRKYAPIPTDKAIEKHFVEPQTWWQKWMNRLRKKPAASFYRKQQNADVATLLTFADIEGTDLAEILREIHQQAEDARGH